MSLFSRVGPLFERAFPDRAFVAKVEKYPLAAESKVALVLA
jgi:hypothetical protein